MSDFKKVAEKVSIHASVKDATAQPVFSEHQ